MIQADIGQFGQVGSKMNTSTATELFESVIDWMRDHYSDFRFFTERDVLWTVQNRLLAVVEQRESPYQVFNDHPMMLGARTDLAIVNAHGDVDVAAEFKYEPSHTRTDIIVTKFPVVSWEIDGVGRDVSRVQGYVRGAAARTAYAVFIDEGSYNQSRPPYPSSRWIDWQAAPGSQAGISVLWTEVRTPAAH